MWVSCGRKRISVRVRSSKRSVGEWNAIVVRRKVKDNWPLLLNTWHTDDTLTKPHTDNAETLEPPPSLDRRFRRFCEFCEISWIGRPKLEITSCKGLRITLISSDKRWNRQKDVKLNFQCFQTIRLKHELLTAALQLNLIALNVSKTILRETSKIDKTRKFENCNGSLTL